MHILHNSDRREFPSQSGGDQMPQIVHRTLEISSGASESNHDNDGGGALETTQDTSNNLIPPDADDDRGSAKKTWEPNY